MTALVNGRETESLPVADRGLQYGDGLFETIALHNGKPLLWERHLQRLTEGCQRLGMAPPDGLLLRQELDQIGGNKLRAVAKIILTRGISSRGYRPEEAGSVTRILQCLAWPASPENAAHDGVAVRWCATRLARQPRLAGLKHLNRLEQVLARAEWDDPAIAEGLMLDEKDQVIEATAANVFVVRDGAVLTPTLHECGVAGVMRALIMELAQSAGMPVRECALSLDAARGAQEIFLTNSVIGVWPVRELDTIVKSIGPTTRRIATLLEQSCPAYAYP